MSKHTDETKYGSWLFHRSATIVDRTQYWYVVAGRNYWFLGYAHVSVIKRANKKTPKRTRTNSNSIGKPPSYQASSHFKYGERLPKIFPFHAQRLSYDFRDYPRSEFRRILQHEAQKEQEP